MFVNSVIIEQLQYDGTLKTVQLESDNSGQLVIAFPDEYEDNRNGPFHFQNRQHNKVVRKLMKANGARKLNSKHYQYDGSVFKLQLPWRNIPTKRGELSYYAVSIPEYAIPTKVLITNPHNAESMKKAVIKDEQKNRYVVYIECRSGFGIFDFDLECVFLKARKQEFYDHQYSDDDVIEDVYAHYDAWEHYATDKGREQINIYMEERNVEIYNVQQAAAVGRNAQANNTQMTQINNSLEDIDPQIFLESLVKLREEMLKQASSLDETLEVAKVAEAEKAVIEGDLNKGKGILSTAGKWTYDIATKLGIALIVDFLKTRA